MRSIADALWGLLVEMQTVVMFLVTEIFLDTECP